MIMVQTVKGRGTFMTVCLASVALWVSKVMYRVNRKTVTYMCYVTWMYVPCIGPVCFLTG